MTGATLTSTGVIDAVNMAILAAQGKDPATKRTHTDGNCDIVVVGAGGAGLSAAVEAASHGDLRIIVLEKQGILGGNTNYSTGGINAAGTEAQQELGINDSPDLFYDDTMRGGCRCCFTGNKGGAALQHFRSHLRTLCDISENRP